MQKGTSLRSWRNYLMKSQTETEQVLTDKHIEQMRSLFQVFTSISNCTPPSNQKPLPRKPYHLVIIFTVYIYKYILSINKICRFIKERSYNIERQNVFAGINILCSVLLIKISVGARVICGNLYKERQKQGFGKYRG